MNPILLFLLLRQDIVTNYQVHLLFSHPPQYLHYLMYKHILLLYQVHFHEGNEFKISCS